MNPTVCPQCGLPLKLIPAGFSAKTQRAYSAFYACTGQACNYKITAPTDTSRPIPGTPPPVAAPVAFQQPSVIPANREESINWLNAKNNACLLIAHHSHFAKEEDLRTAIENLTYWLYLATKERIAMKLTPVPETPPSPPDNSDIDIEEIPF